MLRHDRAADVTHGQPFIGGLGIEDLDPHIHVIEGVGTACEGFWTGGLVC